MGPKKNPSKDSTDTEAKKTVQGRTDCSRVVPGRNQYPIT